MVKRYHKDVYLPKVDMQKFWENIKEVKYSFHFKERFEKRKKEYKMVCPSLNKLKSARVFELYMDGDRIIKAAVRVHGKKGSDTCFVVDNEGLIVTAWATSPTNQYNKIDYSVYEGSM